MSIATVGSNYELTLTTSVAHQLAAGDKVKLSDVVFFRPNTDLRHKKQAELSRMVKDWVNGTVFTVSSVTDSLTFKILYPSAGLENPGQFDTSEATCQKVLDTNQYETPIGAGSHGGMGRDAGAVDGGLLGVDVFNDATTHTGGWNEVKVLSAAVFNAGTECSINGLAGKTIPANATLKGEFRTIKLNSGQVMAKRHGGYAAAVDQAADALPEDDLPTADGLEHYWSFDNVLTDSVGSLDLVKIGENDYGEGVYSIAGNHRAVVISGTDVVRGDGVALDSSFCLFGWLVNPISGKGNGHAPNDFVFLEYFDSVTGAVDFRLEFNWYPGEFSMTGYIRTASGLEAVSIPAPGLNNTSPTGVRHRKYFWMLFYDEDLHKFGVRCNYSEAVVDATYVPAVTTPRLEFRASGGNFVNITESGLYLDTVLSDEQRALIYNNGLGHRLTEFTVTPGPGGPPLTEDCFWVWRFDNWDSENLRYADNVGGNEGGIYAEAANDLLAPAQAGFGTIGPCVYFDQNPGAANFLSLPSNVELDGAHDWTMVIHAKAPGVWEDGTEIPILERVGWFKLYALRTGSDYALTLYLPNNDHFYQMTDVSGPIAPDKWFQLILTYTAADQSWLGYFKNEDDGTFETGDLGTGDDAGPSDGLVLGRATGVYGKVMLDSLHFYRRILTAGNIAEWRAGFGSGKDGMEWPFA